MILSSKTIFVSAILAFFLMMPIISEAQQVDSVQTDTARVKVQKVKKEHHFFSFLKGKNKSDSIQNEADSIVSDSTKTKKRGLFKRKNKKKKTGNSIEKPKVPSKSEWKKMTREDKKEYFKTWNDYDSVKFVEDNYTETELSILNRAVEINETIRAGGIPQDTLSMTEQDILSTVGKKDARLHVQMKNNDFKRRKKMLKFDKTGDFKIDSTMAYEERVEIVKARYEYEAEKEAVRKQKIIKRFNRKEKRLRKKYELTKQEKSALAKGKSMRLRGAELANYKRAIQKQEKFTVKLVKLRKKRAYQIQNKKIKKKLKRQYKYNKKRDAEINKGRNDKEIRKREEATKKRIKKNKKRTKER